MFGPSGRGQGKLPRKANGLESGLKACTGIYRVVHYIYIYMYRVVLYMYLQC